MSQQEHNLQMDYIEFPATDIEATKRFYNQVFGWEFTDYGPGYTSFHDGRLGGGFNGESQPAGGRRRKDPRRAGRPLCDFAGRNLRQGESRRRQDCARDLRLSRRQALPLRRPQRQRVGGVERVAG